MVDSPSFDDLEFVAARDLTIGDDVWYVYKTYSITDLRREMKDGTGKVIFEIHSLGSAGLSFWFNPDTNVLRRKRPIDDEPSEVEILEAQNLRYKHLIEKAFWMGNLSDPVTLEDWEQFKKENGL